MILFLQPREATVASKRVTMITCAQHSQVRGSAYAITQEFTKLGPGSCFKDNRATCMDLRNEQRLGQIHNFERAYTKYLIHNGSTMCESNQGKL